jgi:hypothetical protein
MDTIIQCGTSDRREALYEQLREHFPRVSIRQGLGTETTIYLPGYPVAGLVAFCEGFLQGWRKALCYVPAPSGLAEALNSGDGSYRP